MKYGIQLYSLRQYLKSDEGYREVFNKVKEMGAETVQLSVTAGHPYNTELIKELVKESGLSVCSTHSPFSRIVNDLAFSATNSLIPKPSVSSIVLASLFINLSAI